MALLMSIILGAAAAITAALTLWAVRLVTLTVADAVWSTGIVTLGVGTGLLLAAVVLVGQRERWA